MTADTRDPRDALVGAARQAFAARGYARTTLKGIAAAAGVAPAVLRRYYSSKGEIFAAAMRLPTDPAAAVPALLAPGVEDLGERIVRVTLDALADPQVRDDLLGLARSGVGATQAMGGLQEYLQVAVLDRVAAAIGVPDARMRVALISSYLLGVAASRYVLRLEPLASASDDQVIALVAPTVQALLDPRVPLPRSASERGATPPSEEPA